jgi:hypothetical protein
VLLAENSRTDVYAGLSVVDVVDPDGHGSGGSGSLSSGSVTLPSGTDV